LRCEAIQLSLKSSLEVFGKLGNTRIQICGGESSPQIRAVFKVCDINQKHEMFGVDVAWRGVACPHSRFITISFGAERHCINCNGLFLLPFIASLEALKGTKQSMWCYRGILDWEIDSSFHG